MAERTFKVFSVVVPVRIPRAATRELETWMHFQHTGSRIAPARPTDEHQDALIRMARASEVRILCRLYSDGEIVPESILR